MISTVEYIWLDGTKPTQSLRSKTRILELEGNKLQISEFPVWSFDGSSTYQSAGNNSDLILLPVYYCRDPIRGKNNFLVMCEVLNANGEPHSTNNRSKLRQVLQICQKESDPWIGFEQEYTFFDGKKPLGWPENGSPESQGPFYCGVGADKVFGRDIVEEHTKLCIEAGISIYGINAEVMPGQWEYQIGYREFKNEKFSVLDLADQHWISRWLLYRVAEKYNVIVSFDNKPVKGDWNGAGCHTNLSTKQMRDPKSGIKAIEKAITALSKKHKEHIAVYGDKLEERLTGLHETCSIDEFRAGVADRGASVRIPQQVSLKGYGYLEDRRPGANCDPYVISSKLLTTICNIDESSIIMSNGKKDIKVA